MNNADWKSENVNKIKKEIKSKIKLSEEDEKRIKEMQKVYLIKDQKRVEYLGEIDNE
jgi:hypothetical protein